MKEGGYSELSHQPQRQIKLKIKKYLFCLLLTAALIQCFGKVTFCKNKCFSFNPIKKSLNNNYFLFPKPTRELYNFLTSKNPNFKSRLTAYHKHTLNSIQDVPANKINVSLKAGYLKETEELYSTAAFYQNLKIGKRFSKWLNLGINAYLENAKRTETEKPEIKRWFDNTSLKADFDFNDFNTVSAFVSGSINDTTLTSYGIQWTGSMEFDEFTIKNFLTLSYDYFYYWNQVSQNFVKDEVEFKYNEFNISAGYFFGVVDFNYVEDYDTKARNPNSQFSLDVRYKFLSEPAVNIGFIFNTKDFKYYSPLYFSPQKRKISGVYSSLYETFKDYYVYLGGGVRVDNSNVFIWDFDSEAGYDKNDFSISVGISRYHDPYYTSYNSFLNLTKAF